MRNALEHVLCCFPLLHGGGAAYLGVGVLSGVASAQQVEMLRRQFDELTAQMTVVEHYDERSGDRTHGSREINGTVSVETASRGHGSREVRVVRSWQRHRRLDSTFNGYADMLDPSYPALLNTERQFSTVMMDSRHRKEYGKS